VRDNDSAKVDHVLEDERWAMIESAFGSIPDAGHDWDDDPAAWVRAQRFGDRNDAAE
jgi:hypothetical protein